MAPKKWDKGSAAGRISDPFETTPPPSLPHSPGASSTAPGGSGTLSRGTRLPPKEITESGLRSGGSITSSADPLGGLRTSLDNLNVAEVTSPHTPGTSSPAISRILGGEEEEPHTPQEKILREDRPREAPGAPKKPRRPSGFDREAMARITKKLDFD